MVSPMTDTPLLLADEFPTPTRDEWDVEVLKGFNRRRAPGTELTIDQAMARLRTKTVDDLVIEPLYTASEGPLGYPGVAPFTRGATIRSGEMDAWDVRALHEDPDVAFTNEQIKADLARGATSLWLKLGAGAIPVDALAKVLDGVDPGTPITVTSTDDPQAAAAALAAWWRQGDPSKAQGNLGIDPIGFAARTGKPADLGLLAKWVQAAAEFPGVRAITIDVLAYDDAGAGDVQQLAFAAQTGVDYLRALEAAGIAPDAAAKQFEFRVSANADEFLTIARMRAFRKIWTQVLTACGVEPSGAVQHAVTSWRMVTRDDPWVNLLRDTVAVFSASVGGADAITCLPFDAAHGLPTDFSRRLARNTQIITAEEANVGRVNDPAGGAWVFENLTDDLAKLAWAAFQKLDADGGMAAALESGAVEAMIAEVSAERAKRLATRRQPITGVSMFPRDTEEALDSRPRPPAPGGGLRPVRDSEVFEALRDRAAAAKPKPAVFLARLGEQRDFGARETFTAAMLQAGGIERPASEGGTADEIAAQVKAAGAKVVILCSSAKVYAEQAIGVAKALKAAGVQVWIAGRRTETGSDEAASVIDGEVFDGMDVVGFLSAAMDTIGVAK